MATASPRATPPPARRGSSHASPTANSIAKGATARSAVSPKVNSTLNGISRRPSSKGSSTTAAVIPADSETASRDGIAAALKRETEEKEALLVRVQQKEQTITNLTSENDNLGSALNAAESRLGELYADQGRMEEDMAARLDLVDRLRAQVQELEKEKRDVLRRYTEQTTTFDAERQSFYDNEQHLKSRIQSLIQTRKTISRPHSPVNDDGGHALSDSEELLEENEVHDEPLPTSDSNRPPENEDNEPAEMTSLRLELSTLSTSYSSLQNTVQLLSSQLLDLRRVNNQLQEENESYNILLREKTLNGQFDILRTVGTEDSDEDDDDEESDDDDAEKMPERGDGVSLRSTEKSILDPVDETAEDLDGLKLSGRDHLQSHDDDDSLSSARDRSRRHGRGRRAGTSSPASHSPTPVGESLADLPITGPGLDLAAELGRAENLAILEGRVEPLDTRDRSVLNGKGKKGKKVSMDRLVSDSVGRGMEQGTGAGPVDLDALRSEVKSLKDANKALSLYASKIIDRIIAQEGFEHVLAADYENSMEPSSPAKGKTPTRKTYSEDASPKKKPRPQSAMFGRSTSDPEVNDEQLVAGGSPSMSAESSSTKKAQRRSLSFDWRSFSVFGSVEKKPDANLRPLTLRPGTSSVVGGRKLDTHEDEEDRKERERMNATLKLMGIEKPDSPILPAAIIKSYSSPGGTPGQDSEPGSPRPQGLTSSRFPFFRSRSATMDGSSVHSGHSATNNGSNSNLTEEALERSEAETSLAALDAKEKVLREELAKGSGGGFTELPRRHQGEDWRSRRSKRSGGSGSGSTVWSAGMSVHNEDENGDD